MIFFTSSIYSNAYWMLVVADALPRCLQLMIDYPFNSILHHLVAGILIKAVGSGPPTLLDYLFQDCHLLHWLLTIPSAVNPKQRQVPSSKKDDAPKSVLLLSCHLLHQSASHMAADEIMQTMPFLLHMPLSAT